MEIKKTPNGNYYVSKKIGTGNKIYSNNLIIHHHSQNQGRIQIRYIAFPKEFIGKKVRLKLEITR